ncbi:DUF6629 family protein [Streptomyces sp. MB09-01]|uniref:DUF6629 family protein n=1 Tax=Streptomyces sp. MB09-01 TaxID=3028666 RepID=UPI0029CA87E5|nr:DUF6629 family protein [Streptomyces sp. MB09-01]
MFRGRRSYRRAICSPRSAPCSLLLAGDRRLRTLGAVPAAGAPACSALWRLEFASTWCAFAAVASVLASAGYGARNPLPGRTMTESYLDVCSDFTCTRQ